MADQLTKDEMLDLDVDGIAAAYKAGELDTLLGRNIDTDGQKSLEEFLIAKRRAGEPVKADDLRALGIGKPEDRASVARHARNATSDADLRRIAADMTERIAESQSPDAIQAAFDSAAELVL